MKLSLVPGHDIIATFGFSSKNRLTVVLEWPHAADEVDQTGEFVLKKDGWYQTADGFGDRVSHKLHEDCGYYHILTAAQLKLREVE